MKDPLQCPYEHFDALADMHQQVVLNRHGINIEDVKGNTTGLSAPPQCGQRRTRRDTNPVQQKRLIAGRER
jgi:hypothetical protein